eukprot:Partr_v1_DN27381_c1_g1_i4_m46138 putative Ribosomal protein
MSVGVGVILKRTPLVISAAKPFEIAYQSFRNVLNSVEGTPYNPLFFETQKAISKKVDSPLHLESRSSVVIDTDLQNPARILDRSLYLAVELDGCWQFPAGVVQSDESLAEAANRELTAMCGDNMELWQVGNAPVAFIDAKNVMDGNSGHLPDKIFFMKSQIYSGNFDSAATVRSVSNFGWMTKEELSAKLKPSYFESIQDSLADL